MVPVTQVGLSVAGFSEIAPLRPLIVLDIQNPASAHRRDNDRSVTADAAARRNRQRRETGDTELNAMGDLVRYTSPLTAAAAGDERQRSVSQPKQTSKEGASVSRGSHLGACCALASLNFRVVSAWVSRFAVNIGWPTHTEFSLPTRWIVCAILLT
jgi:hypothetical protein